jgi:uncharacterized membrane protein
MADKHYRSFIKAFTWRLTGTVDTMVITYLVTRTWKWAFFISGIEFFTKIFLYYVHERIWLNISLGKVPEPPKDKPNFDI